MVAIRGNRPWTGTGRRGREELTEGEVRVKTIARFITLVGLLAMPGGAWAQFATSGAIAGVARDSTGAVLPGVTLTLPGFSIVRREGIELTTGFTATVNADMRVGALQETVTVSSASPVVDIQNVNAQTVLSRDIL